MRPYAAALTAAMSIVIAVPGSAATLYRCKAYNGGRFYSEQPCATRKAFVDSTHPVPDGMSFRQQVDLVERAQRDRNAVVAREDRERERRSRCGMIADELRRLDAKYARHEYVPIDEVEADQALRRELKRERSRERCSRP